MIKFISLICFLIVISPDSFSRCKGQISVDNMSIIWSGSSLSAQGRLKFSRVKSYNNDCNKWLIGFSKGRAGNYNRKLQNNSDEIFYNIYKNVNRWDVLKSLDDARNNKERFSINIKKKENSKTLNFFVKIPIPNNNRTFFSKGTYLDNIIVTARTKKNTGTADINKSFTIQTYIAPQIDISLVNSGGTFNEYDTSQKLVFGNLIEGKELGFDLIIRSNSAYSVKFSSINNGKLKHKTHNYFVNYELEVKNDLKNLSSSASVPVVVATGQIATQSGGDTFPVNVRIGETNNKLEGEYGDYVTVTAIANE